VAREAEGSLRDAQSLLEQVLTVAAARPTTPRCARCWARRTGGWWWRWPTPSWPATPAPASATSPSCTRTAYDAQRFCRDLLEHFRHLAVLAATGEPCASGRAAGGGGGRARRAGRRRSADDLQRFFRLLLEADEALAAPARSVDRSWSSNVRGAARDPAAAPPLDDILHRLEAFGAGNPAAPGGGAARESVPRPREAVPGGACGTGSWRACRRRSCRALHDARERHAARSRR